MELSKVPIYIAILVAVILIGAAGYFVLDGPSKPTKGTSVPTPGETALETVAETTTATPAANTTTPVATIKCELCHTDPQNLPPHVNGKPGA